VVLKKIFEEITSAVEKGYIAFNDRVGGSSPSILLQNVAQMVEQEIRFSFFALLS
jgi:hypothetical protein